VGEHLALDVEGPNRLRAALVAGSGGASAAVIARTAAFEADAREPAGEALVVPLRIGDAPGGALVVYRAGARFSSAEVGHAVSTARFVSRALAWSAVFQ